MTIQKTTPKILESKNTFCAGCGHGIINRLIAEVIEEKGYENNSIMNLGVGCSCNMNTMWVADKIQCPHGRAAAVARGVKVARPDTLVMTYQGDGDAYVIGIAETLNAAYKNAPITVFVVNNNNFAMTGGQMSWTTMPSQKTSTSIDGRDINETGLPMKVPEMLVSFPDVAYVARGSVHNVKEINKLKKYINNAIESQLNQEGYSFVEILSQCPTNWKMTTKESTEWIEKEVVPYYPLGELKKRKVSK